MAEAVHASPLFIRIIEVDGQLDELRSRPVVPLKTFRNTTRKRRDLSRAAERALSWNTNKGTTA